MGRTSEKTWNCKKCDSVFAARVQLEKHVREKHCREGQLSCHYCFKKFRTAKYRQVHETKKHPDKQCSKKLFYCNVCDIAPFARPGNRERHFQNIHYGISQVGAGERTKRFKCEECGIAFIRRDNRNKHMIRLHNNPGRVYDCAICGAIFNLPSELHEHIIQHEPDPEYRNLHAVETHGGSCRTYRKVYLPPIASIDLTLGRDHANINNVLTREAAEKKHAKCSIVLTAEFVKMDGEDVENVINIPVRSKTFTFTVHQVYTVFIEQAQREISQTVEDFIQNGSQWVLNAVFRTDLEIARCRPLAGSCGWNVLSITTIRDIQRLTLNGSGDHKCFFYAVARHFVGEDNMHAVLSFVQDNFNITGIITPVTINQVAKFEEQNKHLSFRINILYLEEGSIYPIFASKTKFCVDNHINILLYQEAVEGVLVRHYVYVRNLEKLLRKEYQSRDKRNKKKHYQNLTVCPNCLCKFSRASTWWKHYELCKQNKELKVNVPKYGERIEFTKHNRKFKIPLIGFFDFEAVQKTPDSNCVQCTRAELDGCYHKAKIETEQHAGTFAIIIVNYLDRIIFSKCYSGEDCADVFLETLLEIEDKLKERLDAAEPLQMLPAEEADFKASWMCHICEKPFEPGHTPVRDHCHLTGKFVGAAHQLCNMKRVEVKKIPLFCHNFSGYDSHLIIRALKPDPRIKCLKALPRNTEKFRTVELNNYIFLDSMSFLNGSLADVVCGLTNSGHNFPLIDQENICQNDSEKGLLLQKGIYPYEYAVSVDQLRAAKTLPPHADFYSKVANANVTLEDYEHAQKVFQAFGCTDMLQYTELYCRLDTILLAECFISFRAEVYREFTLDCW